jgi:hypothetical protein
MDRARDAWVHGRLEREGTDRMVQALIDALRVRRRRAPVRISKRGKRAARVAAVGNRVVNAVRPAICSF